LLLSKFPILGETDKLIKIINQNPSILNFQGMNYFFKAPIGSFAKTDSDEVFKIIREKNVLI
jgi:hypothetical protein